MTEKIDDKLRLNHIYDAICDIDSFIENISFADFYDNKLVTSAVIRQLEIIGEASNHLSSVLKNRYSNVDWSQIIGFRNIIAHEYFIVDIEIVWEVIKNDLPVLKQNVETIKKEFKNN